jgi:hypothetical protein
MPNKRVEQTPERKLPTILRALHNYQQDVPKWACETGFLTQNLHNPNTNTLLNKGKWPLTGPHLLCDILLGKHGVET